MFQTSTSVRLAGMAACKYASTPKEVTRVRVTPVTFLTQTCAVVAVGTSLLLLVSTVYIILYMHCI